LTFKLLSLHSLREATYHGMNFEALANLLISYCGLPICGTL